MKKIVSSMLGFALLLASCGQDPQPNPQLDTTKPVVTLVSSKASVTAVESIKLTATATDNVGVTKVEFYDGATKLGEDLSAPYELNVALTTMNNGSKIYTAKAFDAAKNASLSTNVEVLVKIGSPFWQTGTIRDDRPTDIAIDSSGSRYVSGYTIGTFVGNISSGLEDAFLIKYDSNGVQRWVKQIGTNKRDQANSVAVDSTGNIYIVGETYDAAAFPGNTSAGIIDIFIIKYDSNGIRLWTKQVGTENADYASGVSVDASDNIYITGNTEGAFSGSTNVSTNPDVFLMKYGSNGSQIWVKQIGTILADRAYDVAVNLTGDIYVTGETVGSFLGSINAGFEDAFVMKFSSVGENQWIKQIGTDKSDSALGVAVDASGNVFMAGKTGGTFSENSNAGSKDAFLTKYDSSGVYQWIKQFGTSDADFANGITIDLSGNILISGNTGRFSIDDGFNDAFLAKYNTDGVQQWRKEIKTNESDYGYKVAVDPSDSIFLLGETYGAFLGAINLGGSDIFTARYNANGIQF